MKYVSQVIPYTIKDRNRFDRYYSYSQRNDLTTDDLELACIEVKLPYNKSFLVATWYRPLYLMNGFCF